MEDTPTRNVVENQGFKNRQPELNYLSSSCLLLLFIVFENFIYSFRPLVNVVVGFWEGILFQIDGKTRRPSIVELVELTVDVKMVRENMMGG